MTARVLCLRPEADFSRVNALPPASLSVTYRTANDPQLSDLMKTSDALVIPAVGAPLAPQLFEAAPLRLVQVTGIGVDRVDRATMTRLGVPVCNVAGGNNGAVVEYAIATALTLLRRFAWADAEIKAGNYEAFRLRMVADNLGGLDGLTVGIVGFGTIGKAVAQAFARMGCTLCYCDPVAKPDSAIDARAVSLDELLASADVVTLHVPLLPETSNLIGDRELARMKPGAVLIQGSRGGVVDEAALASALTSGHLGGAAVDVYSAEPPTPDNPLFGLTGDAARRLLLTPHIAGITRQSWGFLFRSAWENCVRVLERGEAPLSRVY